MSDYQVAPLYITITKIKMGRSWLEAGGGVANVGVPRSFSQLSALVYRYLSTRTSMYICGMCVVSIYIAAGCGGVAAVRCSGVRSKPISERNARCTSSG
jgi:hypothetical protein